MHTRLRHREKIPAPTKVVVTEQSNPVVRFLVCGAVSIVLLAAVQPAIGALDEDPSELEKAASHDPRKALNDAEEALRQAQSKHDKAGQVRALRLLAMARESLDDYPGLSAYLDQGIALARELGNIDALCALLTAKGRAMAELSDGRSDEAIALFDEAIVLAERYRLNGRLAKSYDRKAVVIFTKLGQSADALALFQKAYALFEGQGNKYWMAAVLGDMGSLIGGRPNTQDMTTAVDYLTRALSLIDPEVYRTDADAIYHNLGVMHYSLKNYAQAKQYFQKGLALARELQFPTAVAAFNYRLGIIAKNEGRLDEALGYFDQALPALAKNDGRFVFLAHLSRAEVLSLQARRTESREALSNAQTVLARMGSPSYEVMYYDKAGEIYARFGEYEEAYRQKGLLREADRRNSEAGNAKLGEELKVRFDTQLKESENALLRSQQKESEARRLALSLALVLSLIMLGGLALYLRQRTARLKAQLQTEQVERRSELLALELNAERERREAQEELVHAGKMAAIGRMVAGVNHEIKRPLASMRLLAENALRLLGRGDSALVADNLEAVVQLTDQLAELSRRLEGFSRKEAAEAEPVVLREIIAGALSLLAPRLRTSDRAEVKVVAGEQRVIANADQLQLVLVNLLANALDAIAGGADKRIEVEVREEGERVILTVRDHGAGLSEDVLTHLFEPFFTTKPPGEGLGLGLALSADVIREMGGELTGRNHPEGGAEFSIRFTSLLSRRNGQAPTDYQSVAISGTDHHGDSPTSN